MPPEESGTRWLNRCQRYENRVPKNGRVRYLTRESDRPVRTLMQRHACVMPLHEGWSDRHRTTSNSYYAAALTGGCSAWERLRSHLNHSLMNQRTATVVMRHIARLCARPFGMPLAMQRSLYGWYTCAFQ